MKKSTEKQTMVENDEEIQAKILKSPFVQDRRPHQFLPRGAIWKIRRWKTGKSMLEVRPFTTIKSEIRHYTSPHAIIKSALYQELFNTMNRIDDQMIFHIGEMGKEYKKRAIEDLYSHILIKQAGQQEDRLIQVTLYENGIRVTVETIDGCKGLFFMTEHEEVEINEYTD